MHRHHRLPARQVRTVIGGAVAAMVFHGGALASENCFDQASKRFGRDPWLYYAIAEAESSMRVGIVNDSHYARTKSVGLGLMQIDSRHLKWLSQYGITQETLLTQPCQNVMVGAAVLEEIIGREGATWNAVGAYNAGCTQLKGAACEAARNAYVKRVWRAYQKKFELMGAKGTQPVSAPPAAARRPLRVSSHGSPVAGDQGTQGDAANAGGQ